MKLRATYRAPDAGRYRCPGWGLGRPGPRRRHAATTARNRCRPRRRGAPLRRRPARIVGRRSRRRVAQHGGAPGGCRDVADAQLVGGPRPLPSLLAVWCGRRTAAPSVRCGRSRVHGGAARARGGVLVPGTALGRAGRAPSASGPRALVSSAGGGEPPPPAATSPAGRLPAAPITPPTWPWSSSPRDRRAGPRPCSIHIGAWPTRRRR